MSQTTAKPGSVAGSSNPAGGEVGYAGTAYKLKMEQWDFDASTRIQETTGDGDVNPFFETSGLGYTNVVLAGFMVPNQAIGLTNLSSGSPVDIDILLTSERKISLKMVVHRVRGQWRRTAVTIPVRIFGVMSETAITALEAAVT